MKDVRNAPLWPFVLFKSGMLAIGFSWYFFGWSIAILVAVFVIAAVVKAVRRIMHDSEEHDQ